MKLLWALDVRVICIMYILYESAIIQLLYLAVQLRMYIGGDRGQTGMKKNTIVSICSRQSPSYINPLYSIY